MTQLEVILVGGIIANLLALNGRIIYSWLSAGHKESPKVEPVDMCAVHAIHQKQLDEHDECLAVVRRDVQRHEVLLTERTAEIFRRLDQGNAIFDAVNKNLGDLSRSQAVMAGAMSELVRRIDRIEMAPSTPRGGR